MTSGQVTEQLADFVVEFKLEDLPAPGLEKVKLAVLDSIGCAVYGSQLPWVLAVREFAEGLGSVSESDATVVWGTSVRLPAANSAMVNGTAIHAFELDDLHSTGVIHPGAEIIPAVLALAEVNGSSSEEVLQAIAVGYEVGCRVGAATGMEQLGRGLHPSATSGAVGAAAGAAKILDLNAEETLHAIAIGATQASGLMSAQYGASVKRWHLGRSAQSGIYAALMATHGVTGARNVLESAYGGFVSVFAPDSNAAEIVSNLGEAWEIDQVGFKVYSCCGSSQTAVEAVRMLMQEDDFGAAQVKHVEVRLSTSSYLHVGWDYEPNGQTAAQMNLSYALAAQLTDGEVFVEQFSPERLDDPALIELAGKVTCIADPTIDDLGPRMRHKVLVTVETESHGTLYREVEHRTGTPDAPVSRERLLDKFHALSDPVLGVERTENLVEAVDRLGEGTTDELLEALSGGSEMSKTRAVRS